MGTSSIISLSNLASNQMIVIDSNGNVVVANVGDKIPAGSVVLEKGEFQSADAKTPVAATYIGENDQPQDVTDDINQIIANIEAGNDPTAQGAEFAAAAGGANSGSSLTNSATITLNAAETIASAGFDTSASFISLLSTTQSLALDDVLIATTTLPVVTGTVTVDNITARHNAIG